MDFFMPAERVLYDRSYYFSDEAVDDYNEYIADRDGVNVDVVSSLDFFMNEVWKEIDYAIDRTASSTSRPPIMTAPPIWTSGSSPGSRTMPRGSSSAANITRPAK